MFKKLIALTCLMSFSSAVFASTAALPGSRNDGQQALAAAGSQVQVVLRARTVDEVRALAEANFAASLPKIRKVLVQAWQAGRDDKLEEIYDRIENTHPGSISAVIEARGLSSLSRAEQLLHFYSESTVAYVGKSAVREIKAHGGLEAFQSELRAKLTKAQSSESEFAPEWGGYQCEMLGALMVFSTITIILIPLAVLMIPNWIWACATG